MISDLIAGEAEVRKLIDGFQSNGLRRCRKATLEAAGPGPELNFDRIDLTVQAEFGADPYVEYVVELKILGIRELRMPRIVGWVGFGALVIEDISDWRKEGVRYRITELEEGAVFYCLCHSLRFTKVLSADHESAARVLWQEAAAPGA